MLGIHDLPLFLLSGLLLNMTPGPDTAYIVGRSAQIGWRGGAAAAFGISTGCLVHVFGSAIGLSAVLTASATAFAVVKWAGAAYLVYLGLTQLLARRPNAAESGIEPAVPVITLSQVFWQGALTNILNPKVAMFFLAFLPQFVAAEAPNKALAFLLLGTIFIVNSTIWCLGVAVIAARTARRVRGSSAALLWLNRAIGGLLVYLGVRIAMFEAR
ncbi:LysE family translocator [Bradyrhizobium sp. 83012]|uniref:LysE family translocator n=1 Tax=Bradyrhizobium aeschynomenes TaxID=2734909 RepID=A0ABX2CIW6_9BRAD|nr:LysE family translocator [Bradyrhizobium aeschynomenes]NPU11073.1 LysE family translocator [Bradyrhizobium aeschynomenes]NPU68163.1 LysE family translocator [Bradyrhizobium aeschynomenes]NPV21730.1 LysE family translocator [Bradyrhizobium aeschynomenes]